MIDEKSCLGNGRFFYLIHGGKLELFYICRKKRLPVEKVILPLFSLSALK